MRATNIATLTLLTELHMLNDESNNLEETIDFVDRSISRFHELKQYSDKGNSLISVGTMSVQSLIDLLKIPK